MAIHAIINAAIIDEIEEAEEIHTLNLKRSILRDASDPFSLPNCFFIKLFRFNKDMMQEIINILLPFMRKSHYSNAVPNYLKVLAAVSFFAYGSYQKTIGQDFNLGLSQSMVSRAITEVSDVMVTHLLHDHILFPIGDAAERAKRGFFEKFQVGGVIGCIDCTHVAIIAPPTEEQEHLAVIYYNRKGFYSINVQITCNSDLVIQNVNARFPGSTHDSAIWANSGIRRHLSRLQNTWLLGDSGYPLEPWLLTPFPNAAPNTPEARYTQRHCTIRNSVERCIGVLKMRFRCLTKARTLNYHPVRSGKIIYSCVILHNIARRFNLEDYNDDDYEPDEEFGNDEEQPPVEGFLQQARRTRADFIRNYFM